MGNNSQNLYLHISKSQGSGHRRHRSGVPPYLPKLSEQVFQQQLQNRHFNLSIECLSTVKFLINMQLAVSFQDMIRLLSIQFGLKIKLVTDLIEGMNGTVVTQKM